MPLNETLIRERCSYPRPDGGVTSTVSVGGCEWEFRDTHGNQFGDLYRRKSDGDWCAVFNCKVHSSGYATHGDYAVIATGADDAFRVYLVRPADRARCIYETPEFLKLLELSPDGEFILLQAGYAGDALHPALLVLDLQGFKMQELTGYDGVNGCWSGGWSPVSGDHRIVVHFEHTGYASPAIWDPFRNEVRVVDCPLSGEVWATWHGSGKSLLLTRHQQGRSDLHRWHLEGRRMEMLQPLDGTIFSSKTDENGKAMGIWSGSGSYAQPFIDSMRLAGPDFKPSRPLTPWEYREIAGVPCFLARPSRQNSPYTKTIFEVYGGFGYHHVDCYNAKIQSLVDHGFLVVLVNTRGCNGFGRAWRDATLPDIGHTELADVSQVRQALVNEGEMADVRSIISGDSWGGYMALLAMGTQPALWRAAIAGVPVGDFERAYDEATPFIRAFNRVQFRGTPQTDPKAYHRASPLTYVDAVKGPVLMLVGNYDCLCPPRQNQNYRDALLKRGIECDYIDFEGAHGPPDRETKIRQLVAVIKFALRHTGEETI
jgi:acetyl esterase/lipase